MAFLWEMTISDMCEIQELAIKMGIKPGESMEPAFLKYANEHNIKPIGQTELTKEEIIVQAALKNDKIMIQHVDEQGKDKYLFIKKTEQTKDESND